MPRRLTISLKPSNWKPIRLAPQHPIPISRRAAVSFVALAFVRINAGLVPSEEVECPLPGMAIRCAQAMSSHEANVGAVAFVRRGPDLAPFGDEVLKSFGEVPEDFNIA